MLIITHCDSPTSASSLLTAQLRCNCPCLLLVAWGDQQSSQCAVHKRSAARSAVWVGEGGGTGVSTPVPPEHAMNDFDYDVRRHFAAQGVPLLACMPTSCLSLSLRISIPSEISVFPANTQLHQTESITSTHQCVCTAISLISSPSQP